jgi:hypothetical protein
MSEKIIEVIQMVLNGSSSNETRKEGEEFLAKSRLENPSEYLMIMMSCL